MLPSTVGLTRENGYRASQSAARKIEGNREEWLTQSIEHAAVPPRKGVNDTLTFWKMQQKAVLPSTVGLTTTVVGRTTTALLEALRRKSKGTEKNDKRSRSSTPQYRLENGSTPSIRSEVRSRWKMSALAQATWNLTAKHEQQPNMSAFAALRLGRNVYSLKEHDAAIQCVIVKGNSKFCHCIENPVLRSR